MPGLAEGYLLTGRHAFFSCYEAFIHIIDSMFNQHAKWLKVGNDIEWRPPIASLNYLLSSHVWRQDHNGFSHQDPGFIDHVGAADRSRKAFSALCRLVVGDVEAIADALDHRARNRPFAAGDANSQHTDPAPANCPAIVTRSGSPPKAEMLVLTQRSASILSRSPY